MSATDQVDRDLAAFWTCTPTEAAARITRTLQVGPPPARTAAIHLTPRQKRRIARHMKHGRTVQAQRIILDEVNGRTGHTWRLILRGWL